MSLLGINILPIFLKAAEKNPANGFDKKEDLLIFENLFSEMHPFLFAPSSTKEWDADDSYLQQDKTFGSPLVLPFPVCAIEVIGRDLSIHSKEHGPLAIQVILAVEDESNPNQHAFFVFLTRKDPQGHSHPFGIKPFHTAWSQNPHAPEGDRQWALILRNYVKYLCDQIGNKKFEFAKLKSTSRSKVKIGGKKIISKPKNIVFIRAKSDLSEVPDEWKNTSIEWSHAWEVRGHWRRISGVGKNRQGLHEVANMTWVKHHTKGDISRGLIKKTRISS